MAMALAMLILCFCPPDSPTPRSPITVSYCSVSLSINSLAPERRAASFTLSHGTTSLPPVLIFSEMLSENRNTSCITTAVLLRSRFNGSLRISVPSSRIRPLDTS